MAAQQVDTVMQMTFAGDRSANVPSALLAAAIVVNFVTDAMCIGVVAGRHDAFARARHRAQGKQPAMDAADIIVQVNPPNLRVPTR